EAGDAEREHVLAAGERVDERQPEPALREAEVAVGLVQRAGAEEEVGQLEPDRLRGVEGAADGEPAAGHVLVVERVAADEEHRPRAAEDRAAARARAGHERRDGMRLRPPEEEAVVVPRGAEWALRAAAVA